MTTYRVPFTVVCKGVIVVSAPSPLVAVQMVQEMRAQDLAVNADTHDSDVDGAVEPAPAHPGG